MKHVKQEAAAIGSTSCLPRYVQCAAHDMQLALQELQEVRETSGSLGEQFSLLQKRHAEVRFSRLY